MATGTWDQQVITYTGDGTAARLIPTTFALNTGVVAVYVMPQITYVASYRHTGMTGTSGSKSPVDTVGGIMSLAAGGFTVTDDTPQNVRVNSAGAVYTAIVFRDSTSDNRFMRVGSYAGNGVSGTVIPTGGTSTPTQVWVFGRATGGFAFCSDNFAVTESTNPAAEAVSLTTQIRGLGVGTFTVGNNNNVNDVSLTYFFAAMTFPVGNPIRNVFATYKVAGAGAGTAATLGFQATFAMARPHTANVPESRWRGPTHTGTQSTDFTPFLDATGGITALGATTITLGNLTGASGKDIYGFALKTGAAALPPVLTSLSPSTGPTAGGTAVTLTGTGFITGATVTFGGVAATSVVFVSSTSITCVAPAHESGAASVVITNSDTQLSNAVTYTYTGPGQWELYRFDLKPRLEQTS